MRKHWEEVDFTQHFTNTPQVNEHPILLLSRGSRDCSGDGVTVDGGYGDITGDKIFTGEVIG